jgi:hypothetical protein
VQEHRRHEHDRGVEIQHDPDRGIEQEQAADERHRSAGRTRDGGPCCFEESVGCGGCTDEQEPGDECKRGPRLRECGVRVSGVRERRCDRGRAADRREG